MIRGRVIITPAAINNPQEEGASSPMKVATPALNVWDLEDHNKTEAYRYSFQDTVKINSAAEIIPGTT